jgi:hypothetical protein
LDSLERVRAGLEGLTGRTVKVVTREEWDASLRGGGEPTRLRRPLGPFLGVQGSRGFECAVASGAPFAYPAGIHHVRRDENDPPEGRINTDSHEVIEDLARDSRWPAVLRAAGLTSSPKVEAVVSGHVFAFLKQRDDHHSPSVPPDIAGAQPKE